MSNLTNPSRLSVGKYDIFATMVFAALVALGALLFSFWELIEMVQNGRSTPESSQLLVLFIMFTTVMLFILIWFCIKAWKMARKP